MSLIHDALQNLETVNEALPPAFPEEEESRQGCSPARLGTLVLACACVGLGSMALFGSIDPAQVSPEAAGLFLTGGQAPGAVGAIEQVEARGGGNADIALRLESQQMLVPAARSARGGVATPEAQMHLGAVPVRYTAPPMPEAEKPVVSQVLAKPRPVKAGRPERGSVLASSQLASDIETKALIRTLTGDIKSASAQGRFDEAAEKLAELKGLVAEGALSVLRLEAYLYARSERANKALLIYERILQQLPQDAEALSNISLLLFAQRDFVRADTYLNQLQSHHPGHLMTKRLRRYREQMR